jgi:hypothetical protein
MQLWEDLQAAKQLSEQDSAEWRDRAIRAEAQAEVLVDIVKVALIGTDVDRPQRSSRGRLRGV